MGRSICRFWILLLVLLAAAFAVQAENVTNMGSYESTCLSCKEPVCGQYGLYSHRYQCEACGYESSGGHQNVCSDLTMCSICGAVGIVVDPENLWQWDHVNLVCSYVDEKHCQWNCTVCGVKYTQTEHTVYCYEPEACHYCGTEAEKLSDIPFSHSYYGQPWENVGEVHQQTCKTCGQLRTEAHYGQCVDPDYCEGCQTDGVAIAQENFFHEDYVYESKGMYYHDYVCSVCGDVREKTLKHWAYCAEQTVCAECGQDGLALLPSQIVHNNFVYENLGEKHQLVCVDCGLTSKEEKHIIYCTDPGVCEGCGLTGLDVPQDMMQHDYTGMKYVKYDEYYHQKMCGDCGYTSSPGEHSTACNDDTQTCNYCHAENVKVDVYSQNHDLEYVDLGEKHQEVCTRCDFKWQPYMHKASCTDPLTCSSCGLTVPDMELTHAYGGWVSIGERCRRICTLCGEILTERIHLVYCHDLTCVYCNEKAPEGSYEIIGHEVQYVNLGNQHIGQCIYCDSGDEPEDHEVECTKPTVCSMCDATGLTIPAEKQDHHLLVVDLGLQHQRYCQFCGYTEQPEEHWVLCREPEKCEGCGIVNENYPEELVVHPEGYLTYENVGEQHRTTCSDCGETMLEDHDYTYNIYSGRCVCGLRSAELPGDANSSGIVEPTDVLLFLRWIEEGKNVNGEYTINYVNADVNNDYRRDEADLLLILQHLSGWDVELQ